MAFTVDEVHALAHTDLSPIAGEIGLTARTALADATIARSHYGVLGRAVLELLRAQASGKLPTGWLADSDAAQQATPALVAQERAHRLTGACVHDVTCSIGTEGAYYQQESWLGSDLDSSRLTMARYNLPAAWLVRADALAPVSRADVIVADPARRHGGRRIKDTIPPLPDLVHACAGREMAIKCAPGIDYTEWDGLVVVSSVDGGVKETCLYTAGLATGGVRREAIVHRTGWSDRITDTLPDDVDIAAEGRYLIDPDGAIVRAGLVRHFAAREELWMLDGRIAYLTGDHIPAGYSGFEIIERVPLKKLRSALAAQDAGSVEILVRGVDVDPDVLRKKLKLRGSAPRAVVITRIDRSAVAFICQPRVHAGLDE